jgi:hypothetical protein
VNIAKLPESAANPFGPHLTSLTQIPAPALAPERLGRSTLSPPVRGSGTHSLNFRKTIRERFPAAVLFAAISRPNPAFHPRCLFARAVPARRMARSADVGNEGMDAAPTRKALSRLTGVLQIQAVFRAHLGDDRKILAASDQTDDG